MSRGDLQEMEQSKTAVNANAKPAEPMPKLTTGGIPPNVEDLGGPTPENYSPTDDSAKLKTPGSTLKQVKDVVNKGAKPAMPMQKEEEEISQENTIEEEEVSTEEVVAEQEVTTEEEVDVEEDVNALLGGEELSEEFKEKAKTIFEAALKSKIAEVKEAIEAEHEAKLAEQVAEAKEELGQRVDSYLEYVSEEWMTENELAVEHGLKTELTESFLSGMKGLFEEHYVHIPDDKYDVLETMVDKLDDMETKLNEQIEKNIGLNKRLAESVADGILESVSDGLATTQKEKLSSLSESVEFESEDQYREKLEMLKESYFPNGISSAKAKTESLSEGVDSAPVSHSGSMANYLKTLSAVAKS
jgi:outer membrane protein OmpA-like peptidoglycan-associated protein|tara:strand:+ start:1607 stop:2680 length:1074 start_codon:yes stop_codon:yes gene_type:complete